MSILEHGLRSGSVDGKIPFCAIGSQELINPNRDRRIDICCDFIDEIPEPILDIGGRSIITLKLENHFNVKIENTLPCDFNESLASFRSDYKTVFCFEVLEHVMNPLLFLRNIRSKMSKDGILYLSTPLLGVTGILQTPAHFTEYKESRLEILFKSAGFTVVRKKIFNSVSFFRAFTGFRPFIHHFFKDNIIFELKNVKADSCG